VNAHAGRGFALLEAIVALTLLAGTGLALFAWINQNLQQASRLREREQQVRLQLTAQQLVQTVNPTRSPTGRLDIDGVSVQWTSRPLSPALRNATVRQLASGAWSIGLYALDVQARDDKTGIETRFERWQVGTERVETVRTVAP
jgi:general secretion pathway protein I